MKRSAIGATTAGALALGAVLAGGQVSGAAAQQEASVASAPVQTTAAKWKLVWNDEFKRSGFPKKWFNVPTNAYHGRSCATAIPSMAKASRGVLSISVRQNKTKAATSKCKKHYYNGQIGTKTDFLYGKFTARIKFQSPTGMHAAFWMLPSKAAAPSNVPPSDLPGYRGVEVDIAEYFGDRYGKRDGGIHSYVYWPKTNTTQQKTGGLQKRSFKALNDKLPSRGFHNYSVEWTPTKYVFRIDGMITSTIRVGVAKRPEYLLLSMLTSDWELPLMKKGAVPASMKVDWVRVYRKG